MQETGRGTARNLKEFLRGIPSSELTFWAAIFANADEDTKNAQNPDNPTPTEE